MLPRPSEAFFDWRLFWITRLQNLFFSLAQERPDVESFRVSLKHGKTLASCFDAFPTPNRFPLRLETL
ncbi:MAG: hypothetical protein C3F11_11605 [Methylocystaceae bacterium]|nr:MAG: hypothetical protein C3F11_11605 [Methylocystaceae bacterium]